MCRTSTAENNVLSAYLSNQKTRRDAQLSAILATLAEGHLTADLRFIAHFLGGVAALNDHGFKGLECDSHTLDGVLHCLNSARDFVTREIRTGGGVS